MVHFYTEKQLRALTNKRAGEVKAGEVLHVVESWSNLQKLSEKYILLGIPEDIGVRANYGNAGAAKTWSAGLTSFCNIQNNAYTNLKAIAVLGEIDCDFEMEQAEKITSNDPHFAEKLGELVTQIDHKVATVIEKIVAAKKIPIIVGGGHNNSFGNLKGASKAIGKPINCINLDAHSDYRSLEHRHSGNGFSYATEGGFLERYYILGLHKNYTSEAIFKRIEAASETIQFSFLEAIFSSEKDSYQNTLQEADAFCCQAPFGIELDMDAIENMGSSAMTSSGVTMANARNFLQYFSEKDTCTYIHICEGAPEAGLFPNQIGKAISYFISDIL